MQGHTLFVGEHGPFWWKNCEISGCPNQICIGRSERFCWPHSAGDKTVEQMIRDAETELAE